jgi:hypothetical protein
MISPVRFAPPAPYEAQVKDKLREAVADLEAGATTDAKHTVEDDVKDSPG